MSVDIRQSDSTSRLAGKYLTFSLGPESFGLQVLRVKEISGEVSKSLEEIAAKAHGKSSWTAADSNNPQVVAPARNGKGVAPTATRVDSMPELKEAGFRDF